MNVRLGPFLLLLPTILCGSCHKEDVVAGGCYSTALIPANVVAGRRLLGKEGVAARGVENAEWFATACPVPLKVIRGPGHCVPSGAQTINLEQSELTVRQNGGNFSVHVTSTPGIDLEMVPARVAPPDTARSTDLLKGIDSAGRAFFIYFDDRLGDTVGPHKRDLPKFYYLQIYYPIGATPALDPNLPLAKDAWACGDEMPDQSARDGRPGDKGGTARGDRQGGVGGGTEPGHH